MGPLSSSRMQNTNSLILFQLWVVCARNFREPLSKSVLGNFETFVNRYVTILVVLPAKTVSLIAFEACLAANGRKASMKRGKFIK